MKMMKKMIMTMKKMMTMTMMKKMIMTMKKMMTMTMKAFDVSW
jgi:hypothetical protein